MATKSICALDRQAWQITQITHSHAGGRVDDIDPLSTPSNSSVVFDVPLQDMTTGPTSIQDLRDLQEQVLALLDEADPAALADTLELLRPRLRTADLTDAATADPDLHDDQSVDTAVASRAFVVELFQTLFDVHCAVRAARDPERAKSFAGLLRHVLEQGLLKTALARFVAVAKQHGKLSGQISATTAEDVRARTHVVLAALVQERIALATLVYSAAAFSVPDVAHVKEIITLAGQTERGDVATVPLALATLACLRISSIGRDSSAVRMLTERRVELSREELAPLRGHLNSVAFKQTGWKNCLILALTLAQAGLRRENVDAPEAREQEEQVMKSDALPWLLTQVVVNLTKPYDPMATGIDVLYRSLTKESSPVTRYNLDDRLQDCVHFELQLLATGMIKRMGKVLADLKKSDDKEVIESEQQQLQPSKEMTSTVRSTQATRQVPLKTLVRCNFEIFCVFLAMLYEGRPDDCAVFWSGETSHTAFGRFLQLASSAQSLRLRQSGYNLIATLVNDQPSASKVFQDVQNEILGGVTWNWLFAGLEHCLKGFKKFGAQLVTKQEVLSLAEMDLLAAQLRLLRQVCRFDEISRRTILSSNYDALSLLFDLFTCPLAIKFKASILEVIASFMSHEATFAPEDLYHIAQRVWSYMEAIAMVPQVAQGMRGSRDGIRQELEEREGPLKHYPLTIAYLHLLENLTPMEGKSDVRLPGGNAMRIFTLVDNLGAPNREPGVYPYFDYLLKDVFLKVELREYVDPREQWCQWRLCLSTIFNALSDLDVSVGESTVRMATAFHKAPSSGPTVSAATNACRMLVSHPAFHMLCDILDGRQLLDGILRVISHGREVFEAEAVSRLSQSASLVSPSSISEIKDSEKLAVEAAVKVQHETLLEDYQQALLLAFKIIYQVLRMQSKFLHEVLPQMNIGTSSKRELDRLMATRQQSLVDLMFFIKSPDASKFMDDLSILSIKILEVFSLAPTYAQPGSGATNSMVAILSASNLSSVITTAYQDRFSNPEPETSPIIVNSYDEVTVRSVRLAMLQLLVMNLRTRATPSIAHVLLGLTKDGRIHLQDPAYTKTSLFSILTRALTNNDLPLPLASLAHELIYHLTRQSETFPVSAYLKSTQFFSKQIEKTLTPACLDFTNEWQGAESAQQSVLGVSRGALSQSIIGTPGAFSPFHRTHVGAVLSPREAAERTANVVAVLGTWSWLLRSLAVQVKVNFDQRTFLGSLVHALFRKPVTQPPMIAILRAAMEVTAPTSSALQMNDQIQYEVKAVWSTVNDMGGWPTTVDANGCSIYDINACEQLARNILPSQREIMQPVDGPAATPRSTIGGAAGNARLLNRVQLEAAVLNGVMATLLQENKQRRVYDAKLKCVGAWTELLSVCLLTNTAVFGTSDDFCDIAKSLLASVTDHLRTARTECKEHFAKAILLLLSLMDRMTTVSDMDQLLLTQVLRTILEVIKAPDSNIVVRGNLYSALLVYLSYSSSTDVQGADLSGFNKTLGGGFSQSTGTTSMGLSFMSTMRSSAFRDPTMDRMDSSNLAMLRNQGGEGLLSVLCEDASNGGLWQTVALSLLDLLTQWSMRESRHWVFDFLYRGNYIQTLIGAVRGLNPALTYLCSSEDVNSGDLSSIFIYESLMSLLTRLALNKTSCELLVEGNLVATLAECSFLSYRVGLSSTTSVMAGYASDVAMDVSSRSRLPDPYLYFSPTSRLQIEKVSETLMRYNQALQPALDAVVTICSVMSQTSDKMHAGLVRSAAHFVTSHLNAFLRILRACLMLVQDRLPRVDDELEMALLHQATQIACIVRFLSKNKLSVPPELSELLLVMLLRFTRAEFPMRERPTRAEKLMLQASSHVIGYCFTMVSDPRGQTSTPMTSSLPERTSDADSFRKSSSVFGGVANGGLASTGGFAPRSRFMIEADLSAAKDRYYSTSNKITLGLLVLFMNQVALRLRESMELEKAVQEKLANVERLGLEDWKMFVAGAHASSDIAHHVSYDAIPESKRADIFTRQLEMRARELTVEAVSYMRMLEVAMTVLFLHVRHYTTVGESRSLAWSEGISASGTRIGVPGTPSDRLASQLSVSMSNLKIDAASVLPDLERTIAMSVQVPGVANKPDTAFLEYLCRESLRLINVYKAGSATSAF